MFMPRGLVARFLVGCTAGFSLGLLSGAGGFPASNVSLYSHLSLADLGGATFAEDCWGYVSASGREYAIIGLSQGTGFVEITDPFNPVITGIVTEPNQGRDMKVYLDYVYSSSDSGPLHIIDVSDIDNGNLTLVDSIPEGATHNIAINEQSGYLYLAIGGPLVAWDLSDPEIPVMAGTWPGEAHDAQVVTYDSGPFAGMEVAFVSAGHSGLLDIVDFTNHAAPSLLGSTTYPGAAYAHQGWLSEDRNYFYLNDELDGIQRTHIFDVSDLSDPVFVGEFTAGVTSIDHNLYWNEGFIFEANYTSGLRIFDACDPENPVEVGFFDTFPANDDKGGAGAWSNYPYFPSGTVIVSDRNSGLFVLDVFAAVIPVSCDSCPSDCGDNKGTVGIVDLLALLGQWGGLGSCDVDGGGVGIIDLLALLSAWGPCL